MSWISSHDPLTGAIYDKQNPMYAIREMNRKNNNQAAKQKKADAQGEAAKKAAEKAAEKANKEKKDNALKAEANALLEGMRNAKVREEKTVKEAREMEERRAKEAARAQEKIDSARRREEYEKQQFERLIENSVKIPQKFLEWLKSKSDFKPTNDDYLSRMETKADYLSSMELDNVNKNDINVGIINAESHGLPEGTGIYLMDILVKYEFELDKSFQYNYKSNIFPSKHFFISVIKFSTNDDKKTMRFNAYHLTGKPITCMRQVGNESSHTNGYEEYEPVLCVFELPLEVVGSQVQLYYPEPRSTISSLDMSNPKHNTTPQNNTFTRLLDRIKPKQAGKLRSAKKTSKRRSVKSKPRHYRRSVGGINHRRKKTTRRRR
jgi:hypothetical protein